MTRPLVLDASVLVALFNAHDPIYRLWDRASRGEVLLIVPACAIAEANHALRATHNAWSAVLDPRDVVATALTEQVAIEIGTQDGNLPTRHVVYEATAVRGIIVTLDPGQYVGETVPLLAL